MSVTGLFNKPRQQGRLPAAPAWSVRSTEKIMRNVLIALSLVVLLVGCSASIPKEQLDKSAFIRAGSTNIWSLTSGGSSVSLTAIDGVSANNSNGPVAVSPGNHKITMSCAGNENEFEFTVKAGEIYEYTYGVGGPTRCHGGLIKVN